MNHLYKNLDNEKDFNLFARKGKETNSSNDVSRNSKQQSKNYFMRTASPACLA